MKTKLLGALIFAVLSLPTVRAAEALDEKQFQKLMKEVGSVAKNFRNSSQAKDAAAIQKDAARTAQIYEQMSGFWKGRRTDDAAKWSAESATAASATAAAAKAGDWEKVKSSWNTVNQNCKACHDAHRQKLPDGGYKIK